MGCPEMLWGFISWRYSGYSAWAGVWNAQPPQITSSLYEAVILWEVKQIRLSLLTGKPNQTPGSPRQVRAKKFSHLPVWRVCHFNMCASIIGNTAFTGLLRCSFAVIKKNNHRCRLIIYYNILFNFLCISLHCTCRILYKITFAPF